MPNLSLVYHKDVFLDRSSTVDKIRLNGVFTRQTVVLSVAFGYNIKF